MYIWLIQLGEPIYDNEKKMRTGILADKLIEKGHRVLRWRSTFDHFTKQWRFDKDTKFEVKKGLDIYAIKGIGYKKHISLRRFIDHRIIAKKFKRFAESEEVPDIIITSTPPYDLAEQAVKFAKKNRIPIIVDIRDEWPELFLQKIPKIFHLFARVLLAREFRMLKNALKGADALTSMMNSMLNWGLKIAKREMNNNKVFYLGCKKKSVNSVLQPKLSFLNKLGDKFIASFVGTFVYNSFPEIFLECAKYLKDEKIHFVLAGDGELLDDIKSKATGLNNITFTGWLEENEIVNLLMKSNIGLSSTPKNRDAFSNKVFSYFAAGLPIVTSYQGELKELIEEEELGFYYPPRDVQVFKDCILRLYNNKELYEKMKNNVNRIFAERFDADKIYIEYANYVEDIAREYKK